MRANKSGERVVAIILFALFAAFLPENTVSLNAQEATETKKQTKSPKAKGKIFDYFRLSHVPGKRSAQTLETSIGRFEGTPKIAKGKKVQVDLVAAVHLGDAEYYEQLNERFKTYDAVLYELVIPEGTEIDENTFSKENRDERGNILASLQQGMSKTLSLEHQLNCIDYTPKNFIHADLTMEEFVEKISERGDLGQTFSRAMMHSVTSGAQEKSAKVEGKLIASLFARNKSLTLKRAFAESMLDQMEESLWILGGDEGSAIISDRNAVAEKRLKEQLEQGKTKIAIFYGAAHLPELEKALQKDFQLKKTQTDWLIAWDLTAKGDAREEKK